jgi:hypothetical protein
VREVQEKTRPRLVVILEKAKLEGQGKLIQLRLVQGETRAD